MRGWKDDGQTTEKERRRKEEGRKEEGKKKQVPHPSALRAYGLRMTAKSDCERQKAKAEGKGRRQRHEDRPFKSKGRALAHEEKLTVALSELPTKGKDFKTTAGGILRRFAPQDDSVRQNGTEAREAREARRSILADAGRRKAEERQPKAKGEALVAIRILEGGAR